MCPPIDPRLVDYLEHLFPVTPATPNDSHAQLMYEGGKAYVVNHLRTKLTHQEGHEHED